MIYAKNKKLKILHLNHHFSLAYFLLFYHWQLPPPFAKAGHKYLLLHLLLVTGA